MRKVVCVCVGLLCTGMLLAGPPTASVSPVKATGTSVVAPTVKPVTAPAAQQDQSLVGKKAPKSDRSPAVPHKALPSVGAKNPNPGHNQDSGFRGPCPEVCTEATDPLIEAEECGINYPNGTNGGCNSYPPEFEPIECNRWICGTYWADNSYRDTDWWLLTTDTGNYFNFKVKGEAPTLIFVISGQPDCSTYTIITYATADPCVWAEVTTSCLPAGTYFFWVGTSTWGSYPCVLNYVGYLGCEPCEPPPPPDNDNCWDVTIQNIPVPGSYTWTGNNTNATVDCSILGAPEVWFGFTIDQQADVTVDLCGSPFYFSTAYIVMVPDCPCSTYFFMSTYGWTCYDGNFSGTFMGLAAGTYYYPLYSAPGYQGDYVLTITTALPPDCSNVCVDETTDPLIEAEECGINYPNGTNGGCNSYPPAFEPIECNRWFCGTYWADNSYRDTDWWILTTAGGEIFDFKVKGEAPTQILVISGLPDCSSYTVLYAATANPCQWAEIVTSCLPAGTYFFWVGPSTWGNYPCVLNYAGYLGCEDCVPPEPPENDNCADITVVNIPVPGSNTWYGNNCAATQDCWAPEVWFGFTIDSPADVTIDMCGSSFYEAIWVLLMQSCCGSYINANTYAFDCPDGFNSPHIYFYALPAGTYYYPLYSSPPYCGDYVFTVTTSLPPFGACCVCGDCVGDMTKPECDALGGTLYVDESCATFTCPAAVPYDCCQEPFAFDLPADTDVVWTGDNTGATSDCYPLSGGTYRELWAKFTTTEKMDVSIRYCGTTPAFYNAYIVLDTTCPCSGAWVYSSGYDNTSCGDGNWSLYWNSLPAGTYYWPLLTDSTYGYCEGPFTVTFHGTVPPPPPECPPDALYGQNPYGTGDPWGAYTSAITSGFQYQCYENYAGLGEPICDIEFWGLWLYCCWSACEVPAEGIPFKVSFYNPGDIPPTAPSGDCCYVHYTPGCEDADCSAAVCAYDPWCCTYYWDSICVSETSLFPECDCAGGAEPVCTYDVMIVPTSVGNVAGYGSLWQFEADLDPCCELHDGWVSVQSQQVGSDCAFLWWNSPVGDYLAYQGSSNIGTNLAFCLTPKGAGLCGDADCDGDIDNFDIDPFVLALTDPAGYIAKYGEACLKNCDTDCDGDVDNFDIDPFVYALVNGECPPPCP